MKMIYRNFFYAVGLILLVGASTLNQDTVELKQFIALLQSQNFYPLVGIVTAILCGLEWFYGRSAVRAGAREESNMLNKLKNGNSKKPQ